MSPNHLLQLPELLAKQLIWSRTGAVIREDRKKFSDLYLKGRDERVWAAFYDDRSDHQ